MGRRRELHAIFKQLLGAGVSLYYQPPDSTQMEYPAIVYSRERLKNEHADNKLYVATWAYSVTVIDSDPDSEIPNKINTLPMTSMNNMFVSEGLYHTSFTLYF